MLSISSLEETNYISNYDKNLIYNEGNNGLKRRISSRTVETDEKANDQIDLAGLDITIEGEYTYTGNEIEPIVIIKNKEYTLELDKDYLVKYENNINAGEATILIEGVNNYKGSISKTFIINKAQNEILEFKLLDREPVGKAKFGEVCFKYYLDETCENEIDVPVKPGSYYVKAYVLATNNYDAIESKEALSLIIKDTRVDIANLTINMDTSYTYTGSEIEPEIIVKNNEYTLEIDKDYLVEFKNNIDSGEATIMIIGINDYFGSVEKTFSIEKAVNKFSFRIDKNGNIIISQPLYGGVTIKYYLDEALEKKATNLIKGNEYYVVIESEESPNYEAMQTEPIKYTYRFDPTTSDNNNTIAYIVFAGIILSSFIIGGSIIFVVLKKNKIR